MARRSAQRLKTVPQHEPTQPREIDFGWLGGTVGLHLRLAQEVAFQAFARRANGVDGSPWRFAVLFLIDANPGLTQGDLAAAIRRNTSSLTPVLDDLCRLDYVVRERLASDRRAVYAHAHTGGQGRDGQAPGKCRRARARDRPAGRPHQSCRSSYAR